MLEHQLGRAGGDTDAFVFANLAGNSIQESSFYKHYWKAAEAVCGIEDLRFQHLRRREHSPKAIQARVGHSSVQVTLDRYGHLSCGADGTSADGLDVTFNKAEAAAHDTDARRATR